MSRAFVKEDIDVPERVTLRRPPSGLPPGAMNLMTRDGAEHLRARLAELQQAHPADVEQISRLQDTLQFASVVPPQPKSQVDLIVFGSRVVVQTSDGERKTFRIVGVDEVDLESGNVSWVSPLGKALLAAQPGKPLRVPPDHQIFGTVVEIRQVQFSRTSVEKESVVEPSHLRS